MVADGKDFSRCFRGRLSLLYAEDPLRVRWGGKGPLIQTNKSATLSCNNDQYLFVPSICLNDQGGAVMNVTYNKIDTLRAQTHGHEPIVLSIAENQQACVTLHEEKANCISVGGGKPGQGYPCILVKTKR